MSLVRTSRKFKKIHYDKSELKNMIKDSLGTSGTTSRSSLRRDRKRQRIYLKK